jgi:hypothetical protein
MARPEYDDSRMLRTIAELVVWRGASLEDAYRRATVREYGATDATEFLREAAKARLRKKYPAQRSQLEGEATERRTREAERWKRDGWPPPSPDLGSLLGDAGEVGTGRVIRRLRGVVCDIEHLMAELTEGDPTPRKLETARQLLIAAAEAFGKTRS